MINKLKAFIVLTMVILACTGCSSKEPNKNQVVNNTSSQGTDINNETDINKVLVTVNDKKILYGEYKKTFDRLYNTSEFGRGKIDINNQENLKIKIMFKDKALNDLITRELIETEAKNRKITVSNAEVSDILKKITQELGGKEALETQLKLNNATENELHESIKKDLVVNKVVEALTKSVKVEESEITKYYNDNKTLKFSHPDQVRASHIFIKASRNEITENLKHAYPNLIADALTQKVNEEMNKYKTKAQEIQKKVKASPNSFAQIAQNTSEDPVSAAKGGDLGFFNKSLMVKPFSDTAFSLPPGTISNVVESEFGYHIIKVTDRRKASTAKFAQVKEIIKSELMQQKKFDIMQKFINSAKDKTKIVFLDEKYKPEDLKPTKKNNLLYSK